MPEVDRQTAKLAVSLLLLIAAGVILSFWPGVVTWDAIGQYHQASTGHLTDWHPPVMAWIWQRFIPIWPGQGPMFLLQLLLYLAGYALLVRWALRRNRYLLAIALAAGANFPFALGNMGSVAKDSFLLATMVFTTGLFASCQARPSRAVKILAFPMLVLASALRANAFAAAFPIATMLMPNALRNDRVKLAVTAIVMMILFMLVVPVTSAMLKAEHRGSELSLISYDLGGITENSGTNVFPPLGLVDVVSANHRCYSPRTWDNYPGWSHKPCAITFDMLKQSFANDTRAPASIWWAAIRAHPIAYLEHRLRHFNASTYFLVHGWWPNPIRVQSTENDYNFEIRPNLVHLLVRISGVLCINTPAGWPAFWFALMLSTIMMGKRLASREFTLPIAWSVVFYALGYAVGGVHSEIRYHLWTMVGGWIVAAVAIDDLCKGDRVERRRLIFAAVPPCVVVLLGTIWRFLPA